MSSTPDEPRIDKGAAATRKFLSNVAELDGTDTWDMDELDTSEQAIEIIASMHQTIETLEARVELLEEKLPDADHRDYEQLDRYDKATIIRSQMREVAQNTNGKAAMQYKDIERHFDGKPSAGHCYDIMETAANGDGFQLGENNDGEKRLTFNESRVNG